MRFLFHCIQCGQNKEMLLCLDHWQGRRGEMHVCRACYDQEVTMAQKSKKAKAKAKKAQQAKQQKKSR